MFEATSARFLETDVEELETMSSPLGVWWDMALMAKFLNFTQSHSAVSQWRRSDVSGI